MRYVYEIQAVPSSQSMRYVVADNMAQASQWWTEQQHAYWVLDRRKPLFRITELYSVDVVESKKED